MQIGHYLIKYSVFAYNSRTEIWTKINSTGKQGEKKKKCFVYKKRVIFFLEKKLKIEKKVIKKKISTFKCFKWRFWAQTMRKYYFQKMASKYILQNPIHLDTTGE